jgi:hypothetical protein
LTAECHAPTKNFFVKGAILRDDVRIKRVLLVPLLLTSSHLVCPLAEELIVVLAVEAVESIAVGNAVDLAVLYAERHCEDVWASAVLEDLVLDEPVASLGSLDCSTRAAASAFVAGADLQLVSRCINSRPPSDRNPYISTPS